MTVFFDNPGIVNDQLYSKIRSADNRYLRKARRLTERMWSSCGQFVDANARERAKSDDFYAVWWELFLAYSLSLAGIALVPTAARPHVGKGHPDLLTANPRIWIEAVMPQPGTGPDALNEPPLGEAYSVPVETVVLRLRTAIQEKCAKIGQYLRDGTIQPGDPAIVAVAGARLPFRFSEGPVPTIVRAVCAVGNLVLEIDRGTMKHVATTVEFNDRVSKKSKATVATDLFLQKESASVSAVLYSASDCVNYPRRPGV